MSTANKLTYLNETKGKIKDAINLTNANILSEDTFRSYAEKLKLGLIDIINNGTDDLYNSFPKTTGTGTEIALNDTYEAPMEIGLKGNTEQQTYTGKNLFDKDNANIINAYVSARGIITSSPPDRVIYIPCKPDTTYTVQKMNQATTNRNRFRLGTTSSIPKMQDTINQLWNAGDGSTVTEHTITTNSTANYLICYCYSSDTITTFEEMLASIQIEEGSTATEYEKFVGGIPSPNPDYPQQVEVVTGDNTINIHGKNLLQITTFDDNTKTKTINGVTATINDDGSISASGTATANAVFALKKNTLNISGAFYYLCNSPSANARVELDCVVDGTRKYLNDYGNGNRQTANSSFVFNNLYVLITNGTSVDTTFKPMVALGTNVTEYQSYQSKDYEISLGTIELCKIGNCQDYIYKENNKWYKHSEIGKLNVDTSNITLRSNYTNIEYAEITKPNDFIGKGNYNDYNVYCSHAISDIKSAIQYAWDSTYRIGKITNKANVNALWLGFSKGTGLDNIKTALNGAVIYYALATPTITEITDTDLIEQLNALKNAKSVNDKTFISQTNEQVPFILDVSALSKN